MTKALPHPANMILAKLPISGLVEQKANALVAWTPGVSLAHPLLIVLFFHGREMDPQAAAWQMHALPRQLAEASKNAVLIAPTMAMSDKNNVISDYLATHERISDLVREGVSAIAKALFKADDRASTDATIATAGLHLAGYSNGYLAWTRAVETLLQTPAAKSNALPPPAVGHSLFDCLYWNTTLMTGVDCHAPASSARFSSKALALLRMCFVTTHFTKGNPTLAQAGYLDSMVKATPSLHLHSSVPTRLDAQDVVLARLPTNNHFRAVSYQSELARVIAAVDGFDLPPSEPTATS